MSQRIDVGINKPVLVVAGTSCLFAQTSDEVQVAWKLAGNNTLGIVCAFIPVFGNVT